MKSYKLVNSGEVREKARRMGYSCINNVDVCFLFLKKSGAITTEINDWSYYANHTYQEITQADFLALPEPFKVGDWVKCALDESSKVVIFKVFKMDGNMPCGKEGIPQVLECTKLTPEQIKVLGLE